VYALLDLADRVQNAADPLTALSLRKPITERPANAIRGAARLFTSDVEDKPWYNDRQMWPRYLTLLAAQRFNRFHLAFGIGYDFLRNVTDGYFLFAYPFLLPVPGYHVRVPQLPDSERDRNLAMLKFVSEQTVVRGLRFQLGLWMHGYEWIDSPSPNYTIDGLTRETHGPYCRDAVRALLQACPAIGGVTFRVHGESGVEEGSYDFWKAVFEGVATCGRKVEIDMHSKGMDQGMLDLAVASGMPVKLSPKYWAEHMGMSYHQAGIRELERPRPVRQATGLMKLSAGSRSFLRYGYGDLLREDRRWGVLHRIWPGTQRLLLWGDPLTAAAHSRAFAFCGSEGVEIMEPLSFKGRRGSGLAGNRCAYADVSLRPRWDWEKYAYTYRVWGRLLYNPESDPEAWRRYLGKQFGPGAPAIEAALANASRILPIVTTAHCASAANNAYWPELYLNQSLVDPDRAGPYRDTPAPRVFGNVSPLDPQLFSRINDFADELLQGERGGKYSPVEAAQWIEDCAAAAALHLAEAEAKTAAKDHPEYGAWPSTSSFRPAWAASSAPSSAPRFSTGFTSRPATASRSKPRSPPIAPLGRPGASWPRRPKAFTSPTSPWARTRSCAVTGWTGCRPSMRTSPPWPGNWSRSRAASRAPAWPRPSRKSSRVLVARRSPAATRRRRGSARASRWRSSWWSKGRALP
ncbi:MAG: hypothetical protein HYR60_00105, partial [Acidobacteria bacterium]|nr:hypothetical protein [Acidobacteriota bacterium]